MDIERKKALRIILDIKGKRALLNTLDAFIEELLQEDKKKYNELIMAVKHKYPNKTRHETALRYIKQAEMPHSESGHHLIKFSKEKE